MKKNKNAAFTGHRGIRNPEEIRIKVRAACLKLIKSGVTHFLAGGAVGFDRLASEEIIEIQKEMPQVKLTLVLSCSFDIHTLKWSDEEKEKLKNLMQSANEVVILQEKYTRDCYKKRNQYLIDNSDFCVCCYDKRQFKSGTSQAVRMAEKRGIEVINLFPP